MRQIKVFIIDDSAIYRKVLRNIIDEDPGLVCIGYATDGISAIQKLKHIKPDIVTLDIEMPNMGGLETLAHIMSTDPTPVLMVSAYTTDGANVTLRALELGAIDYLLKPDSNNQKDIEVFKEELVIKLNVFTEIKIPGIFKSKKARDQHLKEVKILKKEKDKKLYKYVAIGSSTGGTVALSKILPKINKEIQASIFVVQHMPKLYTNSFAERLNTICPHDVKEAADNDKIEPGHIYIAQGDKHMEIDGNVIRLSDKEHVNGHRPSIDVFMNSISQQFGNKTCGVILTGMGRDGANGIEQIKDAGGFTIAQDKETSVIYGMPKAAKNTGKIDAVLPLDLIPEQVNSLFD